MARCPGPRGSAWIRVVETERVPQTTISAGMFLQIGNGVDEPLGDRIIEVPEDAVRHYEGRQFIADRL